MVISIVPSSVLIIVIALGAHVFRRFWFAKHIGNSYPPGPDGTFWAGNLKDIPRNEAWLTYTSWRKQYGDLIHLRVFGEHILIINSYEVAIQLLEKRSKIYSDRPQLPVIDMMGFQEDNTAFIRYSNQWRLHRKLYQKFLRFEVVSKFEPIQQSKVHAMLRRLLDEPQKFSDHSRNLSGAIIMKAIYGIDVAPENDFYIGIAEAAVKNLCEGVIPGAMLVNTVPLLRHIPSWFPGAYFKRFTEETRRLAKLMITVPFEVAQENADPSSSVAKELLVECQIKGGSLMEKNAIRGVCLTSYLGGSDTTVAATDTFFYSMLLFPEAQKKAQMEIDEVVRKSRLPDFNDRGSLPYVEAVYREVMRWRPVAPMGIPRATSADDDYNGYFIPKGTTVIPNIWAMTHDENNYEKPEEFRPERFFKENGRLNDDALEFAFGFGRRICPGRHMGNLTVWLTIATVLSVFDIRKAKDHVGNEIPVTMKYSDGIVSHPLPFECSITPRRDEATQLINNT